MDQFLRSIHRYVQLGVHIKGYYSKELQKFKREVAEVVEFYVDEDNNPGYRILYKRTPDGKFSLNNPSKYLLGYLESQGVSMRPDILVKEEFHSPNTNTLQNNNVNNNMQSNGSETNNYVRGVVNTNNASVMANANNQNVINVNYPNNLVNSQNSGNVNYNNANLESSNKMMYNVINNNQG